MKINPSYFSSMRNCSLSKNISDCKLIDTNQVGLLLLLPWQCIARAVKDIPNGAFGQSVKSEVGVWQRQYSPLYSPFSKRVWLPCQLSSGSLLVIAIGTAQANRVLVRGVVLSSQKNLATVKQAELQEDHLITGNFKKMQLQTQLVAVGRFFTADLLDYMALISNHVSVAINTAALKWKYFFTKTG